MKKLFSLSVAGLMAIAANAQRVQQTMPDVVHLPAAVNNIPRTTPTFTVKPHSNAKGTAMTAFVADTFKSTSIGTGPNDWIAGGNTGTDSWVWKNTASTNLSALNSTTKAGGWLAYDAWNIAKLHANTQPQIGYVTSPSYSTLGHTYVGVVFQQYTQRLADSFFVDVSTNNFASFTRYNVNPNNGLGGNLTTDNPSQAVINITAAAANQPSVKIRFYYKGVYSGTGTNGSGGTYGWSVDDFYLVELDPVDLGLINSAVVMTLGQGTGVTPVGTMPKLFVDSLFPLTAVNNIGGTAQNNVTVNAAITLSGSPVYTKNLTFASMPINAYDSLADFSSLPGYVPTASGVYSANFSMTQAGDGNTANNTDAVPFNVSDSSLAVFTGYIEATKKLDPNYFAGGYYLHSAGSSTNPPGYAFYTGSIFEIPAGSKKDTITSVSLCVYPGTTVGSKLQVELYQLVGTSPNQTYNPKGKSAVYTITTADVSTSGNYKFISIPLSIGTSKSWTIADAGTWAVVVRPVAPTPSQFMVLASAPPAAPASLVGRYGVNDTSADVTYTFGQDLTATGNFSTHENMAALVVNFGNSKALLPNSVKEIAAVSIGTAFPNPANNTLNIPVSGIRNAEVNVSMSNLLGQVLKTQVLGTVSAGQTKTAIFSTSDLANGIYLYTVESNGERVTNRVVVTH
jgi:hypothetical protein